MAFTVMTAVSLLNTVTLELYGGLQAWPQGRSKMFIQLFKYKGSTMSHVGEIIHIGWSFSV